MKPKQMMLFAVAIGCGLVAMLGAQQVLSGNKPEEQEKVKILVSKTEIELGVPLDKTNVELKEWPVDNLPEGAITDPQEIVDHGLKHRTAKGAPILKQELGAKGVAGINTLIPKGMEVVSLGIDATNSHSNLLREGSFVNITCSISRPSAPGMPLKTVVRDVLKRVKVFAVQGKVSGVESANKESGGSQATVVSLLVYPNQGKLLNYAKTVSDNRVYISMLGEESDSKEVIKDFDEDSYAAAANDLLGGDKNPDPMNSVKPAQATQKPLDSSFSQYLKQAPVVSEVKDLGQRPTRPKWVVDVWNGNEKKPYEFDLPPQEATKETVKKEQADGNQWTAPFMQFFSSRKRARKVDPEETQLDQSEQPRIEKSNDKSAAGPAETIRK